MAKNLNTKVIFFLLIFVLVPILFSSCVEKNLKKINVEKIQELTNEEKWGIITSPYATFYENPEISRNSTVHGRKGDIVQVFGKRIQVLEKDERATWYKLENGWVQENDIFICTNRLQAENYAKSMKTENSK